MRQRMGEVLERWPTASSTASRSLFTVEEGRLGVVVTFLSMLELAKEQLLEIVQEDSNGPTDPRLPRHDAAAWPAPIYVKSLAASATARPTTLATAERARRRTRPPANDSNAWTAMEQRPRSSDASSKPRCWRPASR